MKHHLLLIFFFMTSSLLWANEPVDTTKTYAIQEVEVTSIYQNREIRSMGFTQQINKEQLKQLNVLQASDALKYFSGVTVKDYGGVGGLKTVSLRSLGAEHTGLSYDGIAWNDFQTGQIDLGKISLENVDELSLSIGQGDQIFQPARLFASAGLIHIQTLHPSFTENKDYNLQFSIKSGSWGLINPTVIYQQKINDKWSSSIDLSGLMVDGNYPYKLYYGSEMDSISSEKRKNTNVDQIKVEASVYGQPTRSEQWRIKSYFYQSSRGLPGATTYYYNYSSQHLWDKNFFTQAHYKNEINELWVIQALGKWSWSHQRYLDPDYKGVTGRKEEKYYQTEYYLSASALYRAFKNLSFSLALDGSINTLNASSLQQTSPTRYTLLPVMAGKYASTYLTVSASLLGTFTKDKVKQDKQSFSHQRLNPQLNFSIKPFLKEDFRIRFFYKDIFRLPTFNDLYYGQIGNKDLLPEKSRLFNVGVTYAKRLNELFPNLTFTADAYYNKVDDKIVAIPTKNLFVWSIVNLGEVDIKGIDLSASLATKTYQSYGLHLMGKYTYQRSLDVTDPKSKTYKHQIAYTPRVSGSFQATVTSPWINVTYSLLYSGKRYALGQNIAKNRLSSYKEHNLTFNKDFTIKKMDFFAKLEILNLANENYEVIKNFPMPGRSFRVTLKIKY
ncbi:MAG: TonB-dependent receptor plug domain-containing protein [Bacteroidales bacterium]|nr:TonB-dependent receptor plug domain-containing protein [Bacteroidales bacterium]